MIAQRFVEQNQNVTAKQPIVKFQDVDEIEVAVDVPETVMAADIRSADIVQMVAEFSGAPGLQFPVQIREVAQVADPTTQTFQIRVAMKAPPDVNLLPGHDGHGHRSPTAAPVSLAIGFSSRSPPFSRTPWGSKSRGSSARIKPSRAAR